MKPNFRLEDIALPISTGDTSAVIRTLQIENSTTIHPRCDGGDHCYGCNSAEPKRRQTDIIVYSEAA